MIPFRIKRLTETAKLPTCENNGDLWDIYADNFESPAFKNNEWIRDEKATIYPNSRVLVKTGISLELPKFCAVGFVNCEQYPAGFRWVFDDNKELFCSKEIFQYAVADIRPRSGLALKHGITVLNSPGTIDNSYRKELGVILVNHGHEPYTINKGDKIAQMLIRPLYDSGFEEVKDFEDTGRGGYGSTGK